MKLPFIKMSVGSKTLIALSVVFWIPVIGLSLILFFSFRYTLYEDALTASALHLKGAKGIYEERAHIVEGLLAEKSDNPKIQELFIKKDTKALQSLLFNLGRLNSYVDIWIAVDNKQRALARRDTDLKNTGDLVKIGDALPRTLARGEAIISTELVTKNFLLHEDVGLAKKIEDVGIVQFVTYPIDRNDETVGAIVAGIIMTGDPWLGNTTYHRFGAETALFAGESPDSAVLHSTASLPRSVWTLGMRMPDKLKQKIALGKPYFGIIDIAGTSTLLASEPIKDSRNRIIGALSVSQPAKRLSAIVIKNIGLGLVISAGISLILALIATFFVRAGVTQPIDQLLKAMNSVKEGEIDVGVKIRTGDEFDKLGEGFNSMANGIREREERLKKHYEVTKLLMSTLNLEGLLETMLKIVMDITESQIGIVYLYEESENQLAPIVSFGTPSKLSPLNMEEGFPGMAAKEKTTQVVKTPVREGEQVIEMGFAKATPAETAYIPLIHQERILGVLVVGSVREYKKEQRMLFDFLANQLSIALDNAIMHHKIQELSITDPLTTLYNRRYLNMRFVEEWARCQRHKQPLTVILSDVDNFKSVNDTYGHDRGDDVLRDLSKIFKKHVRKEDVAARYGGEEFVLLLTNCSSADAAVLAERIRKEAENTVYSWMDNKAATISIGIATFPEIEAENSEELVQAADHAMYKAKLTGKNKVEISTGLGKTEA